MESNQEDSYSKAYSYLTRDDCFFFSIVLLIADTTFFIQLLIWDYKYLVLYFLGLKLITS